MPLTSRRRTRLTAWLAAAAIALLALAPAALAAGSSEEGYVGAAGVAQTQVESADEDNGSLPFTGYDALLVGGAGLVLLTLGLGTQRLARARR